MGEEDGERQTVGQLKKQGKILNGSGSRERERERRRAERR
jgi:hypothetical protein